MILITSLYTAALALLFVGLSVRTLRLRRQLRIAVGDGGDAALLRAMRVHANFAEYVPLALLLLYFVEVRGVAPVFVHILGGALLLGRVLHAYGVSQQNERFAFRVGGMALTFTVLILSASVILVHGVFALPG